MNTLADEFRKFINAIHELVLLTQRRRRKNAWLTVLVTKGEKLQENSSGHKFY